MPTATITSENVTTDKAKTSTALDATRTLKSLCFRMAYAVKAMNGNKKTAPKGIKRISSKKAGNAKLKIIINDNINAMPVKTILRGFRCSTGKRRIFLTNKTTAPMLRKITSIPKMAIPGPFSTRNIFPEEVSCTTWEKTNRVRVRNAVIAVTGAITYL
jgi:hypothetical protein